MLRPSRLLLGFGLFASVLAALVWSSTDKTYAAACTPQSYGTVTQAVSIPTTGSYRVWSRIKAPDSTSNSYQLEIDGTSCFTVGNATLPANTWTWVDYQNGTSTSKITINLTAGNHTLKMLGSEADVQLDRVIFTSDTSCVPTGTGENCANPPDTTSPVVSISKPTTGVTVTGSVAIEASATDDTAVTKVEFYVDGSLKGTDTTAPYSYNWDATYASPGTHQLTARAYDAAGNVATSAATTVIVPAPAPIDYYLGYSTSSDRANPQDIDGKTVSGNIYVQLLPTTNVTKVNFWIDAPQTSAPYSETTAPFDLKGAVGTTANPLDTTKLTNGPHQIIAEATSSQGTDVIVANFNVTGGVPVTPPADTTAPSVNITSPAANALLKATTTIAASASDNVGVTKVEFYVDNGLRGTDTSAPYSYDLDTTKLTNTTHSLTVKAYDAAGNVKTSNVVSVQVQNITYRLEDINQDGKVNILDFSVLSSKYNQRTNVGRADINQDGIVNILDFSLLSKQYGT